MESTNNGPGHAIVMIAGHFDGEADLYLVPADQVESWCAGYGAAADCAGGAMDDFALFQWPGDAPFDLRPKDRDQLIEMCRAHGIEPPAGGDA